MSSGKETPTPTRGVPIELDRTRYLRFSLGTLRRIREEFGEDLEAGLSGDKLAKVLWYGLRGSDPELTVEQLEEIIDLEQLPAVIEALGKAMGNKAGVRPPEAPGAVTQ